MVSSSVLSSVVSCTGADRDKGEGVRHIGSGACGGEPLDRPSLRPLRLDIQSAGVSLTNDSKCVVRVIKR
jgi:hypothetical protein